MLTEMRVEVGTFMDGLSIQNWDVGMLSRLLLLIAGTLLLGYWNGRLSNRYAAEIQANLYRSLIHHASMQSELRDGKDGKIVTLMTKDVDAVNRCILRTLQRLIPDVALFLVVVYTLGQRVHWLLALGIVVLCTIQIIVTWVVNTRLNGKRHDFQNELDVSNQAAFFGIDNLEAVKAYSCEELMSRTYRNRFENYNKLNVAINRVTWALSAGSLFFTFAIMFLITIVCGELAAAGRISIGTFFVALTLIDSVISPVMRFHNSIQIVLGTKPNVERIDNFLSTSEQSLSENFEEMENKIEFQEVCFSYVSGKQVLDHVSFSLVPGKCNYMLGKNGCGKSTIVKLLLGVQRAQAGRILVMGHTVDAVSPVSLCRSIAVLTQDTVMLPTTIWDNLTLHDPQISKERVYSMCKAIGIHDEINAMPDQYATLLQDRGEPLSVGQRKRIAIARTLLRDASSYIFDEPSAGLDHDHVLLLKDMFHTLAQERIVLIITHDAALREDDGDLWR